MYIFLLRLWLQISPYSISVLALESLGKETHCEIWRLGKDVDVGRGHSATLLHRVANVLVAHRERWKKG